MWTMRRKPDTTGWAVLGLGTLVTTLGTTLFRRSRFGAGLAGFGLAHVVLGALDMARPTVRE